MSGIAMTPEMSLITDSVKDANARIRFFRVAFGSAGAGQMIALREIRSILDDVHGRTKVDWQADADMTRAEAKLAFLLILCLESSMPRGGTITLRRDETTWRFYAKGDRMAPKPSLWALAAAIQPSPQGDPEDEVSPGDVHFALAGHAAEAAGARPAALLGDALIEVSF
ncbi:histidine phosphotransferase family protein [Mesobaculum littorinae]|nr:histidine phosphotransferase family protein [Mesobaculum littorinae]